MNSSLPHSLKSTESSSYEIMFSILDAVDTINEVNKKLENKDGDPKTNLDIIFHELNVMTIEMKSLIQYWLIMKQRTLYKEKK